MTPEDNEHDRQIILGVRLGLYIVFGGTIPPGLPPEAIQWVQIRRAYMRLLMPSLIAAGVIVIAIALMTSK